MNGTNTFFLTTAIAYVNDNPHIGYAYEVIIADVLARYKRLLGLDTFFLTGGDEHSLNVEKKAVALGLDPLKYCEKMTEIYKRTWKMLGIEYNDYIRTSEERHKRATYKLLQRIEESKDIYKGKYAGWYCPSCETFYQEKDIIEGKCPVHKIPPQWVEEENFFFALSKYTKPLLKHLKETPGFIKPQTRYNEVLNVVQEQGLLDISISRASVRWGIPFPFDESQVVYVWVDALVNYISGIGYGSNMELFSKYWPCQLHIIGKDIIRFHCLIWPAMLISAGLELPEAILSHGFITVDGEKVSKTKGNVVDPAEIVREYGADALRFFLLREIPVGIDGDFSITALVRRINTDLANELGNLVNRSLSMIEQYRGGCVPQGGMGESIDIEVRGLSQTMVQEMQGYMDLYEIHKSLERIWDFIKRLNRYIEKKAPWKLAKESSKEKEMELSTCLYNLAECLRVISIVVSPVMPATSVEIWKQLGIAKKFESQTIEDALSWGELPPGTRVTKGKVLFQKR